MAHTLSYRMLTKDPVKKTAAVECALPLTSLHLGTRATEANLSKGAYP